VAIGDTVRLGLLVQEGKGKTRTQVGGGPCWTRLQEQLAGTGCCNSLQESLQEKLAEWLAGYFNSPQERGAGCMRALTSSQALFNLAAHRNTCRIVCSACLHKHPAVWLCEVVLRA
jgi:hypothetical protein